MITADIHTHTSFSGDSTEPMESMIEAAIKTGLTTICFTEHMDMDYPVCPQCPEGTFLLNTDAYHKCYLELADKYKSSDIDILFGVELGLQPHLAPIHSEYVKSYPFDFIIGSEHTTNKKDPYYPQFYEGRSEYDAYCEYFCDIMSNLNVFCNIDTLGHLDYVVRYGPNKNKNFTYSKYSDCIDSILRFLVGHGIGLEINSSGYKYNLGEPNPGRDILMRYRELGGEILTIGSDAHDISRLHADFDKVNDLAIDCGFKYYCVFKNRKPEFIPF